MNKRIIIWMSVACLILSHAEAEHAGMRDLPAVTLELSVLNIDGTGIPGAQVQASCDSLSSSDGLSDNGITDQKGECILKFRALGKVNVYAAKLGYYTGIAPNKECGKNINELTFDPFIYNDRLPRTAQIDPPMKESVTLRASIVLRRIEKPISLCAKKIRADVPQRDIWLGYDLQIGDWVNPNGKGEKPDLLIRSSPKIVKPFIDPAEVPGKASLEIACGDGGGFVRVTEDNGWLPTSKLTLPHLAPESGYVDTPTIRIDQTGHEDSSETGRARAYYFRTRLLQHKEGESSACYGKINSIITYIPLQRQDAWFGDKRANRPAFGSVEFIYYFNPTPNDRNLEFDPTKNLIKGLEIGEQVDQP